MIKAVQHTTEPRALVFRYKSIIPNAHTDYITEATNEETPYLARASTMRFLTGPHDRKTPG